MPVVFTFALPFYLWNGEGPVPRTGHRPAGRKMFRSPRTIQARRAAQVIRGLDEPAVRAKRGTYRLPDSHFDLYISARQDRSWKRHRLTQWR